jgi:trehalose 6-phosphate phosphatase
VLEAFSAHIWRAIAMIVELTEAVLRRLETASGLWLFLDYDGTLAEFAPTPDHVAPDPQVIETIRDLVDESGSEDKNGSRQNLVRVSIVSGRRLAHIRTLLPMPGVLLAGTYGIEMHHPVEGDINRIQIETIQPVLDAVRPLWAKLVAGRQGFYLEDKGWALALHARFASDEEAEQVLSNAKGILDHIGLGADFRVLGGSKFLEVGPAIANKGKTVEYLLDRFAWPEALTVFVGDDDKDEEAFAVIQERGGIAVVVAAEPRPTRAEFRLEAPLDVRRWLQDLALRLR